MEKKKIAFVCVHNSCRSQIAEALCNLFASDQFEAYSCGTQRVPKINQDAVRIMKEKYGIDMEETQYSKLVDEIPAVDIAISMGCNVVCPYVGKPFDDDWGLEDPTGKDDEAFLQVIEEIERRIMALKEDCSMEEKTIASNRGTTYYWTNEKESELTLVFLPGLTADHRLFEKQIEYFKDKYRVLVWDCPCHGKSRPYDEFSYSNITEELESILGAEGINKAVFVGQSLGGMVAQYYMDAYPERAAGFVAIDSAPFGDYYSKSDMFWLNQLEWMCKMFPNKMLRKSMAKMCGRTEWARDNMMEMLNEYSKKELCHLMYIGEAAFIPENKEMDLPCKTILLLGSKDKVGKVVKYNNAWSAKTGYPLHILEGAAHNSNADCPDEVNKIIENFVRTL